MPQLPIAELKPELSDRDSTQFRAAVTLIWPYSSSQRQFALLLAEPNFRLRRKKGQVRARFHGSSAKALATTGVGIGDEVILSLRGAHFVQEDTVSTPGRSIDWELEYTQTVTIQVFRDGSQIANLELENVAPTPVPRSPVRTIPAIVPSPAQQWSSPAFLKRVRLSDGPSFEAPYDPLAEGNGDGHDKKRRRKSYRDWNAWTYSARTPSPDKQDVSEIGDSDELDTSPSRQTGLPDTPVSQPNRTRRTEKSSKIARRSGDLEGTASSRQDRVARDDVYYDLYAGPDEMPPSEAPYAFGGDTEVNTEEEDDMPDTDGDSMSTTEPNTEDLASSFDGAQDVARPSSDGVEAVGSPTEEIDPDQVFGEVIPALSQQPSLQLDVPVVEVVDDDSITPVAVMAPPTLHALNTDIRPTHTSGLLTPIGREPASPTLEPLDSATLPLPSPFPGERDAVESHYLDQVPNSDQAFEFEAATMQETELPSDADYIMENSFFSSIGSSKTPGQHRDHETAFTPVRFTFGMDGAGWSRPLPASSPVPQQGDKPDGESAEDQNVVQGGTMETFIDEKADTVHSEEIPETIDVSSIRHGETALADREDSSLVISRGSTTEVITTSSQEAPVQDGGVVELSSDSEDEEDEVDDEVQVSEFVDDARSENDDTKSLQLGGETEADLPFDIASQPDEVPPTIVVDEIPAEDYMGNPRATATNPSSDGVQQGDVQQDAADTTPMLTDVDLSREHTPFAQVLVHPQDITSSFTVGEDFLDQAILPELVQEDMVIDPQPTLEHSDPVIDGNNLPNRLADYHPDIKLESIEEDVVGQMADLAQEEDVEEQEEIAGISPDKMLIDVPSEGDHLGELHTIAVPNTSPARNTRAKVRISVSPSRDVQESSQRVTRSTRSKASAASGLQRTPTPPAHRERSTLSPSIEDKRTSPYSLRSQSKLLSPTQSTSIAATSPRRSNRRHVSQKSVDSIIATNHAQEETRDGDVADDDWMKLTNLSDHATQDEGNLQLSTLKPPPSEAGRLRIRSDIQASAGRSQRRSTTPQGEESVETASPTPRIVRTTRNRVYSGSVEPSPLNEVFKKQIHEQAANAEEPVSYPDLRNRRESADLRSSPPVTRSHNQSLLHHSNVESNRLLTPDATQQTDRSQASQSAAHQAPQTLPMSPQLTQMSTGLRSFDNTSQAQVSPHKAARTSPRLTKTTPRRNVTSTDIASHSSSPREASPELDSDHEPLQGPTTSTTKPTETGPNGVPAPTVGLSTPLAYYTPLSNITYFLNRSSQFHTTSNPDILALVTSPTTPATRATKGPKHWNTTLHITDASIYPSSTSVNLFRAYSSALPVAETGDVILLRSMSVKSLNRQSMLISADESAWCVWRYAKPVWGKKKGRGVYGDVRAREEVTGPEVERGEGEWKEVGRIRDWFVGTIRAELEEVEKGKIHTRSSDKKSEGRDDGAGAGQDGEGEGRVSRHRYTRSQDKGKQKVVD